MSSNKHFYTVQELQTDAVKLAQKIYASGYKPDFLVAIWRGGSVIGLEVQEYLSKMYQIKIDHICIRTSSYEGMEQKDHVEIHGGMSYILNQVTEEKNKILVVDDVCDSGKTFTAIKEHIETNTKGKLDLRFAAVADKPQNRKVEFQLDFRVGETNKWMVYPHEMTDMSDEELYINRGIDSNTGSFAPTYLNYLEFCEKAWEMWKLDLKKEWFAMKQNQ
jgi:hypoxanthine phosphoribosyltransferase